MGGIWDNGRPILLQNNFNEKVSNLEKYTITKNDVLEIVSRISKVDLSKLEKDLSSKNERNVKLHYFYYTI